MKYIRILFLTLALFAANTHAQTLKSLSYNATNGQVVYSGTNPLTFTSPFTFSSNSVSALVRSNLGLDSAATNPASAFQPASANLTNLANNNAAGLTNFPANVLLTNSTAASFPTLNQNTTGTASNVTGVVAVANGGTGATNAANAATSLGLGASDVVTFRGMNVTNRLTLPSIVASNAAEGDIYRLTNTLRYRDSTNGERLILNATDNLANLANVATARTNLGLGTTNDVTFNNITASGTLTSTGNITMSGTANTAPNQTAASSSSLMTRALVDSWVFQPSSGPRYFAFNTVTQTATFVTNSGIARTATLGYEGISATNANSTGTFRLLGAASAFSTDWRNVDWGSSYVFGARMVVASDGALNTNHTQYLLWGTSSYNSGNPTGRSIGFRINGSDLYGVAHNGTNYTEPVLLTNAVTANTPMNLYVTTTGNGGASWYLNNTLIGSSTNAAPSTVSATFQNDIIISSQSGTNTTANSVRFISYYFWIYKPL